MRKQTILVTGATSGIGRHAAIHLAKRGHRVFASGRNQAALAAVATQATADGAALELVALDVTDAASVTRARDAIHARTGGRGIDVLINNAGFGVLGPTELITDADMRAQYETNVFGLMAVTRAFLPEMRARRSGRIINVSSLGGRHTLPFFGVYNSTKYAVESLSDALRIELGPFGVDVVLIEPGAIETEFTPRSLDGGAKYRRADSPYAPVMGAFDRMERMAKQTSVGPATVSRAIARASESRRPRARYVAPRFAGLFVALMKLMPTRWADQAARLMLGFTRRNFLRALPAAAMFTAFVAASLASPVVAHADTDGGWQQIKQSDGITVYKRVVDGSPLKEFRGRAVVAAPVADILAVFNDVPRATEWMDSCNGSRAVADISDSEKVVYNRTHAPWPVADRDAVLHNVARFDEHARSVELDFWSVDDAKAPPVSGVVRMPYLRGHWILWPSTDGTTTRVEYQVHANPGGALPNWLVNYVSRDLPFKTIEGLRAQVKRRQYPEFEAHIKERFAQYPFLWPRSQERPF
ncbi:MAG TPA: SDR family NAD(P)-dependent oxidoreductase [Polyangia bacterium]|nr:SDR family NAD(P)-dependent oxidoreductase [Polyangia bacterium]